MLMMVSDVMLMLMVLNMTVMLVLRVVERPVSLLLEVLGSVVRRGVTTAAWLARALLDGRWPWRAGW